MARRSYCSFSGPTRSTPLRSDLDFASKLSRVPNSIQLGRYLDETTAHTTWFIPETHYLESWGDCRAFDGTASLVQPLIEPLFQGHSLVEILALAAGERTPVPRRLLEQAWKLRHGDADFARFWDTALAGGVIPDSAAPIFSSRSISRGSPRPWRACVPRPPR